jgi:hypothetical protein
MLQREVRQTRPRRWRIAVVIALAILGSYAGYQLGASIGPIVTFGPLG